MNRRPYSSSSDLELLQDFNARALAETQGCGYIHPGDIPHRLFSGNKYYDPADILSIWEDREGVAAWIMAEPRHKCFDAQIRAGLKGSSFAGEVIEDAEQRTRTLMQEHDIKADKIWADAFRCDQRTRALLDQLGWTLDPESTWTENRMRLVDLPEPSLPTGYAIRAAEGVDDAASLAAVHLGAFPGSKLTPKLYQQVMESPGYAPEREHVVVAPDGAFAAFTVTWDDPINKTILFEPVGTHPEHRRKGLATALMHYVMKQAAASGLEQAVVVNEGSNQASRALYRSCGFLPWQQIDDYYKEIGS